MYVIYTYIIVKYFIYKLKKLKKHSSIEDKLQLKQTFPYCILIYENPFHLYKELNFSVQ